MIEIKFRCWNAHSSVMHDWEEMVSKGKIHLLSEQKPSYPVMQFTGLLDKNGVEIYEGDIVGFGDDTPTSKSGMYGELGVVVFNEYIAKFDVLLLSSARIVTLADHDLFSDGNTCRVVYGNIHQNPKLLK